jgi:SAM-dependent methyltransferase
VTQKHWEHVYADKDAQDVSWYQPHLEQSFELLDVAGVGSDARVVDIGGGASTLVDDLLARGFRHVTVVDLSPTALDIAKRRLGSRADQVTWIEGDVTELDLGRDAFDVWHDRAVFHFLAEPERRKRYISSACRSLRVGGHIILATFAPEGPDACSGLPVTGYSAEDLQAMLGPGHELVAHAREEHQTPRGATQSFVYCLCRKTREC